jgi:hypothetical protein
MSLRKRQIKSKETNKQASKQASKQAKIQNTKHCCEEVGS